MDAEFAIGLYVSILEKALPIAWVFGMGNLLVSMVLNAAFGGRLSLGGDSRA